MPCRSVAERGPDFDPVVAGRPRSLDDAIPLALVAAEPQGRPLPLGIDQFGGQFGPLDRLAVGRSHAGGKREPRSQIDAPLREADPHPKSELEYITPYELLVAVALSAQATDKSVNLGTRRLFPVANTPRRMLELGVDGITPFIRHIGLYNTKAKNVVAAARILIEQHAGALPVWLAPVQVVVLNITDTQADYAQEVAKSLQKQGVRAEVDLRNEKITYKIREHSLQKVPYILVVGDKEKASGAVAVRARGNQDLGVMSLAEFQEKLANDIATKV